MKHRTMEKNDFAKSKPHRIPYTHALLKQSSSRTKGVGNKSSLTMCQPQVGWGHVLTHVVRIWLICGLIGWRPQIGWRPALMHVARICNRSEISFNLHPYLFKH